MAVTPLPDKWLFKLDNVLSWMLSACKTHTALIQLCVLSSVMGLAQAAAVDPSPRNPTLGHKTCSIFIPVLFSCLLVAFLIAVWWVRRRVARRAADRGSLASLTPSTRLSIPLPAFVRLNRTVSLPTPSGAPQAILNLANALTAAPIENQWQWTKPKIVFAVLSILLTIVGLVLGGMSLLYAKRQVSQA